MRQAPTNLAVLSLIGLTFLACDSDYTLDNATPGNLDDGNATETQSTPLGWNATPTPTDGTEDPGGWELSVLVEPPEADFGYMALGCGRDITLQVINDGTVPVNFNNLRMVGRSEAMTYFTDVDFETLLPGELGHLLVSGTSVEVGEDSLEVHLNIEEQDEAIEIIPITASVSDGLVTVIDNYEYTPLNDVDVLWVIDNSGSMGDDQEAVAANFEAFLNAFVPMGIHYHMGVVTTDMMALDDLGKLQGTFGDGQHFIDWTLRESGELAFTQVIDDLGSNGSASEKGLQAMERAISEELQLGWNYGFLREDADLAVIFVSDENDQSPGSNTPFYYRDYLRVLEDAKGSLDRVVCSSIIDYSDGGGYIEIATETGGVIAEIGGDYYEILLEVGLVSAGQQPNFELSQAPDQVDEVVVTVNGESLPAGEDTWTYDEETQEVVFADETLGDSEAYIVITYTSEPNCDISTAPVEEEGSRSTKPKQSTVIPHISPLKAEGIPWRSQLQ